MCILWFVVERRISWWGSQGACSSTPPPPSSVHTSWTETMTRYRYRTSGKSTRNKINICEKNLIFTLWIMCVFFQAEADLNELKPLVECPQGIFVSKSLLFHTLHVRQFTRFTCTPWSRWEGVNYVCKNLQSSLEIDIITVNDFDKEKIARSNRGGHKRNPVVLLVTSCLL